MIKITDNRFTYPFWVDAGENYYIVYFRSFGGNFICLQDDILPMRVGMVFRYDELKKDIFPAKEASTSLTTNNINVDNNKWKLSLYGIQNFSIYNLVLTWTKKIPEINFENYLGKCFTISSNVYGRHHYLVVRNNDKICLSMISQLNPGGKETYITFLELVEQIIKDIELNFSRSSTFYGSSNNNLFEFDCNFIEPDVFLKLT
jgi:hypothetical protein